MDECWPASHTQPDLLYVSSFLLSFLLFAPFIRALLSCSSRNQKFKERRAVVRATRGTHLPAVSVVKVQSDLISFASDQRRSRSFRRRSFVFTVNVAEAAIVAFTTGSECAHMSSRSADYHGDQAEPRFRPRCWVLRDKQIQFCSNKPSSHSRIRSRSRSDPDRVYAATNIQIQLLKPS